MDNQILLSPIPLAALTEALRGIVRDEMSQQQVTTEKDGGEELLTRAETIKILKISLPTLHQWTKDGLIKSYQSNSRIRYKKNEVLALFKEVSTIKNQPR